MLGSTRQGIGIGIWNLGIPGGTHPRNPGRPGRRGAEPEAGVDKIVLEQSVRGHRTLPKDATSEGYHQVRGQELYIFQSSNTSRHAHSQLGGAPGIDLGELPWVVGASPSRRPSSRELNGSGQYFGSRVATLRWGMVTLPKTAKIAGTARADTRRACHIGRNSWQQSAQHHQRSSLAPLAADCGETSG